MADLVSSSLSLIQKLNAMADQYKQSMETANLLSAKVEAVADFARVNSVVSRLLFA